MRNIGNGLAIVSESAKNVSQDSLGGHFVSDGLPEVGKTSQK